MRSHLEIRMALAYACSDIPAQFFSESEWASPAANKVRQWLMTNDLIDANGHMTDRLKVYTEALCDTPLPVHRWVMPDDE